MQETRSDRVVTPGADLGAVRENLYPGALAHVRDWDARRLDTNAHVKHSSQALCLSVFGTIAESPRRKELTQAILAEAGLLLVAVDEPTLECEVRDDWELLRERGGQHSTCPDVLITWPDAVLTVESKFTERPDVCGQPKRRRRTIRTGGGKREAVMAACSGNYEPGSDLVTGSRAACRLTVREGPREARRYWEIAPRLFRQGAITAPQKPCPFADGRYQLMRNLSYAAAWAERAGVAEFGFLLAYAGGWRRAGETEEVYERFHAMLLPEVAERVGSITYERIAALLGHSGHGDDVELAEWIGKRLRDGVAGR
jgi:hypothetical protein